MLLIEKASLLAEIQPDNPTMCIRCSQFSGRNKYNCVLTSSEHLSPIEVYGVITAFLLYNYITANHVSKMTFKKKRFN